MVRISKHKLEKEVWGRVWDQCVETMLTQQTHKGMSQTLDVLLTSTERIMFAKRVGMIVMIKGGYSCRVIAESLHVSPDTVWRWHGRLEKGEFLAIEKRLKHPATFERILATIEALLYASMPPIAGRNRFGRAMQNIEKARKKGSYL
jgi:Trp operon repressor